MKRTRLTALLTTIAISTTMAFPAFATEPVSNTVAPASATEHKELTFDDMYDTDYATPYERFDQRAGDLPRVSNIVTGYPDGTFRPYSTISKAEVAVIIANSMDYVYEEVDAIRPFSMPNPVMAYKDVNKSHPNYAAIKECYEAGVFTDSPDGLFKPDKMLTQAEAVTILANRVIPDSKIAGPYARSGKEIKQQIPEYWAKGNYILRDNYALLADIKIFRESEIKLAPDQYISRIDFVCMLENLFWYELPQLEKFTPEQEADLAMKFKEYPGCEPYYISNLSSPIQYTTKFSDISDLKEYQKYALTRCVEK